MNKNTKKIQEMKLFPIDDGETLIYVTFDELKAYIEEGIATETELLIFEEVKNIFSPLTYA